MSYSSLKVLTFKYHHTQVKVSELPGGPVVGRPPASAEDTGPSPGPG